MCLASGVIPVISVQNSSLSCLILQTIFYPIILMYCQNWKHISLKRKQLYNLQHFAILLVIAQAANEPEVSHIHRKQLPR